MNHSREVGPEDNIPSTVFFLVQALWELPTFVIPMESLFKQKSINFKGRLQRITEAGGAGLAQAWAQCPASQWQLGRNNRFVPFGPLEDRPLAKASCAPSQTVIVSNDQQSVL